MNFLQSLVDELSTESSDEQYSELLDYAIEATQLEINQVLGFSQAIESNYHHHFSLQVTSPLRTIKRTLKTLVIY